MDQQCEQVLEALRQCRDALRGALDPDAPAEYRSERNARLTLAHANYVLSLAAKRAAANIIARAR